MAHSPVRPTTIPIQNQILLLVVALVEPALFSFRVLPPPPTLPLMLTWQDGPRARLAPDRDISLGVQRVDGHVHGPQKAPHVVSLCVCQRVPLNEACGPTVQSLKSWVHLDDWDLGTRAGDWSLRWPVIQARRPERACLRGRTFRTRQHSWWPRRRRRRGLWFEPVHGPRKLPETCTRCGCCNAFRPAVVTLKKSCLLKRPNRRQLLVRAAHDDCVVLIVIGLRDLIPGLVVRSRFGREKGVRHYGELKPRVFRVMRSILPFYEEKHLLSVDFRRSISKKSNQRRSSVLRVMSSAGRSYELRIAGVAAW
ncbi:trigger factor [Striga asiatica]|uniref:Trigger factor n=1 Tax=Striga asiatica TaxID=4170 RepID=A0A5A7R9C9_STRAF|nr:trigger factor [Striga asiatica]